MGSQEDELLELLAQALANGATHSPICLFPHDPKKYTCNCWLGRAWLHLERATQPSYGGGETAIEVDVDLSDLGAAEEGAATPVANPQEEEQGGAAEGLKSDSGELLLTPAMLEPEVLCACGDMSSYHTARYLDLEGDTFSFGCTRCNCRCEEFTQVGTLN